MIEPLRPPTRAKFFRIHSDGRDSHHVMEKQHSPIWFGRGDPSLDLGDGNLRASGSGIPGGEQRKSGCESGHTASSRAVRNFRSGGHDLAHRLVVRRSQTRPRCSFAPLAIPRRKPRPHAALSHDHRHGRERHRNDRFVGRGSDPVRRIPEPLPSFWNYAPRIPHGLGAFALLGLVTLHVGAALTTNSSGATGCWPEWASDAC